MKKLLIILTTLAQMTVISGQQYFPFPDSNAVWNQYFQFNDQVNPAAYFFSYGLVGDTVIGSRQYSKVYQLFDTLVSSNSLYMGCLREDSSKRVFYTGWDFWRMEYFPQEIQLYDFSKNTGDSIIYGIWGKCPVWSVDSVLVGTNYRKRFHVLWETYIEGIGSVSQLLSPVTDIPTKVFTKWDVSCFRQDGQLVYLNPMFPNCFTVSDICNDNTENRFQEITIYPQPLASNSVLDLTSAGTGFRHMTIYNLLGNVIRYTDISEKSVIHLNSDDFVSGIYLARLSDADDRTATIKFIVK
ncbi:MAG TPA: T9SS type A sorting domain-containing protein [Bacteroidales bacterium]|nr:T9SS type A sorting domain-containing protein [Bacteroidales bacterium]